MKEAKWITISSLTLSIIMLLVSVYLYVCDHSSYLTNLSINILSGFIAGTITSLFTYFIMKKKEMTNLYNNISLHLKHITKYYPYLSLRDKINFFKSFYDLDLPNINIEYVQIAFLINNNSTKKKLYDNVISKINLIESEIQEIAIDIYDRGNCIYKDKYAKKNIEILIDDFEKKVYNVEQVDIRNVNKFYHDKLIPEILKELSEDGETYKICFGKNRSRDTKNK